MLAAAKIKTWYLVHKWTSLVCTIFLFIICVTGLPLIFHEEIEHLFDEGKPIVEMPADTPMASLDRITAIARAQYPNELIDYVYLDPDAPQAYVGMTPDQRKSSDLGHAVRVDVRSAELLHDGPLYSTDRFSFMGIMLALHMDLYAGLAGELFLGLMGLLFCVAIVSGVVLYGPFMKKLDFGTVRAARSTRIKWLDLHNLLGVVTLVWAFVVGLTGVINELSTPLFRLWQATELTALLEPYKGKPVPQQLASPQLVADTALAALPGTKITSMAYPGNLYGSPQHFTVWMRGDTPLTSKLHTPVLVDGSSGELAKVAQMPWYLTALEVSRPLHFGDYGGLPLKIIWALLDLITIVVLASGLYLWIARRKATDARVAELVRKHQQAAAPQRKPA
ncbi:PepSY-associated TM helix domain-containing protein [Bordetella holmesii]|uniref:PepSY domain protein n=2 Tax=Bordetella holmesii TaxID=35814 RepID=A0A158M2G8_9BORD|nr:PepSY-associated TM helix domain-containing protein [Bordetella holmesii]AHV94813.1 pepSY-associated TM helix family protein [Bordetella holmesii ATCC 51541]AIT27423.1 pepSY-associated TM helix family protein [Bordetella holmesii 44057]EWM42021.1 pepSY-associated TM helix family protein [Bordetella holmesii 41130]EWM48015.1 pepSY-associated TM helix family protein [Bordetella holmesii 35009]EWM48993.1 pepSY-associated TM helix family protein [Bordetella holmesii 70147]